MQSCISCLITVFVGIGIPCQYGHPYTSMEWKKMKEKNKFYFYYILIKKNPFDRASFGWGPRTTYTT